MLGWIISIAIGLIVIYILIRRITKDKVIYQNSNIHSGFKKIFSHSCKKPC